VSACRRVCGSAEPAQAAQDALHPDHRLGVAAAGVANETPPLARLEYCAECGERGESPSVERDLAHDRVALGDLPKRAAISPSLRDQGCKLLGRQEVRADHKTVPVKRLPVLLGDEAGELAAASLRQPIGERDAARVEAPFIEAPAADDSIAFKGFCPGRQLGDPNWRHGGPAHFREHLW
jgi:hypothetical protein